MCFAPAIKSGAAFSTEELELHTTITLAWDFPCQQWVWSCLWREFRPSLTNKWYRRKQTWWQVQNVLSCADNLKYLLWFFFSPEKNQPYSAMNQWRFSNMNKWTLNCAIESFKLHYQELYCLNLFKSPICSQATNSLNRQRFCENQWESCRQNSEYHFNHKLYTWWILSHDHNRGPQKYSILVAFISFLCATSSAGDQEGNISYKPLGSGKQATFLLMHLKKCF